MQGEEAFDMGQNNINLVCLMLLLSFPDVSTTRHVVNKALNVIYRTYPDYIPNLLSYLNRTGHANNLDDVLYKGNVLEIKKHGEKYTKLLLENVYGVSYRDGKFGSTETPSTIVYPCTGRHYS